MRWHQKSKSVKIRCLSLDRGKGKGENGHPGSGYGRDFVQSGGCQQRPEGDGNGSKWSLAMGLPGLKSGQRQHEQM